MCSYLPQIIHTTDINVIKSPIINNFLSIIQSFRVGLHSLFINSDLVINIAIRDQLKKVIRICINSPGMVQIKIFYRVY